MTPQQLIELTARPHRNLRTFGYDLPNGLLLAWLSSGPGVQLEFDLETDGGADDWTFWWLNGGGKTFEGIKDRVDRVLIKTLHLDHLPGQEVGRVAPLTPLLALINRHRSDLMSEFAGAPRKLWRWWFAAGRTEYFGHLDWLVEAEVRFLHQLDTRAFEQNGIAPPTLLVRTLSDPDSEARRPQLSAAQIAAAWQEFSENNATMWKLPNEGRPYFTNGFPDRIGGRELTFGGIFPEEFALIYTQRLDLQEACDSRTAEGLADLVLWWFNSGRLDHPELQQSVDSKMLHSLHLQYLRPEDSHVPQQLTPLLKMLWARRTDLQAAFDVATADGVSQMRQWWSEYGEQEYFPRAALPTMVRPRLEHELPRTSPDAPAVPRRGERPSVGLVGYPRGEFGLGEDVRLLRAALDRAKVENFVVDAPWKISARQSIQEPAIDASVAEFDSDVMFYVMPPFDTVTLLNVVGPRAFSARRKIGFWQWELEKFPDQAKLSIELVDEIWCHSEHAAKAFRAATDKPVIKVPLPVSVPAPDRKPRAWFGLPEKAFLVFTSFDGASAIARKNPLGAILAFQEAFQEGTDDTRLIVKAMNTENDSLWRECRRKAAADSRITIIDDVMDRDLYYQLLQNCDAVLSLHRAEGFGRLMAEAMALEVPVIASRYSGNLDFMTNENSWLIDGNLVPVMPGDYAFYQGQQWLEPSVAAAARALRECAKSRIDRQRRTALGLTDITTQYNLDRCGQVYRKLIHDAPSSRRP